MVHQDELFANALYSPKVKSQRRRRPETPPPSNWTDAERKEISRYCRQHHPQYMKKGTGGLAWHVEQMLLWHRSHDKWRRDWVATALAWLNKQAKIDAEYAAKHRQRPQRVEPFRGGTVDSLKTILETIKS